MSSVRSLPFEPLTCQATSTPQLGLVRYFSRYPLLATVVLLRVETFSLRVSRIAQFKPWIFYLLLTSHDTFGTHRQKQKKKGVSVRPGPARAKDAGPTSGPLGPLARPR